MVQSYCGCVRKKNGEYKHPPCVTARHLKKGSAPDTIDETAGHGPAEPDGPRALITSNQITQLNCKS